MCGRICQVIEYDYGKGQGKGKRTYWRTTCGRASCMKRDYALSRVRGTLRRMGKDDKEAIFVEFFQDW